MFLENTVNHTEQFGWIEVICGSMFSGKTEELIRRLKRAQFAKQSVEIFKPALDTRYDEDEVVSHNDNRIRSTPVPVSSNIRLLANDVDVVGIDEAQFFDDEIVAVCNDLANRGVRRKAQNDKIVMLGETQEYEPLSRAAYYKALQKQKEEILSSKEAKSNLNDTE
jgi:thymidine kinase